MSHGKEHIIRKISYWPLFPQKKDLIWTFSHLKFVGKISYVAIYNASKEIVIAAFASMASNILGAVNSRNTLQEYVIRCN